MDRHEGSADVPDLLRRRVGPEVDGLSRQAAHVRPRLSGADSYRSRGDPALLSGQRNDRIERRQVEVHVRVDHDQDLYVAALHEEGGGDLSAGPSDQGVVPLEQELVDRARGTAPLLDTD